MRAAFGKPLGREPLIVQEPGEAFTSGLLIPLRARQLGLAAGLLVKDRGDESRECFELMPMCPRQSRFDIVLQAYQVWVCLHHKNKLAQVR